MKIIVHKIEIKPNDFEIFFNVGENHYKEALGLGPGASLFLFRLIIGVGKTKSPRLNY
jgi:hypothetical protein